MTSTKGPPAAVVASPGWTCILPQRIVSWGIEAPPFSGAGRKGRSTGRPASKFGKPWIT
jgi:hypothetical protein